MSRVIPEDAPPDEPARAPTESTSTPDEPNPTLDALWTRVLEAWDDDKPHGAILDYAMKHEALPELAGRYRRVKDSDADKAARAQKKLDGIVVAATQLLMTYKSPPRTKIPASWTITFALICLVVVGWLGNLAYRMLGHR